MFTGTATYLVQPDDTCASIAALYNNFTLSILYYWNPYVRLALITDSLSLPYARPSISFTFTPLPTWHLLLIESISDIGQTCFGLQAYVPVCIDTPWYKFVPPVQPPAGTIVSAQALPVPVMPSITPSCTSFELVGDGLDYTVEAIVEANNITEDQFLDWNTYINRTDPVVWAGYWSCVAA